MMPKSHESLDACLNAVLSTLKRTDIIDQVKVLSGVSQLLSEWLEPSEQLQNKTKLMTLLLEIRAYIHRIDPITLHEQNGYFSWTLEGILKFYKAQLESGAIKSLNKNECDEFNDLLVIFSRWVYPMDFYSKSRLVTGMMMLNQCYMRAEETIDDSGMIALINAFSVCVAKGPKDDMVRTIKSAAHILRCITYTLNHSRGIYDDKIFGDAIFFLLEAMKGLYSSRGFVSEENHAGLVSILSSIALIAKRQGITLRPDFVRILVRAISVYLPDSKINKVDLHGANLDGVEVMMDFLLQNYDNKDFVLVVGRGHGSTETSIKEIVDPILKINRPTGPVKDKVLNYLQVKQVIFTYTLCPYTGMANEGSLYVARTDSGRATVQDLSHRIALLVESRRLSPLSDKLNKNSPRGQSEEESPSKFMFASPVLLAVKRDDLPIDSPKLPVRTNVAPPSIIITAPSQERLHSVQQPAPKVHRFSILSNKEKIKYLCFIELSTREKTLKPAYLKLRTEILSAINQESDQKFKSLYLNLLKKSDGEYNHESSDIDKILGEFSSGSDAQNQVLGAIDDESKDYDPDYMIIDSNKM
jgi:hypothetical protein